MSGTDQNQLGGEDQFFNELFEENPAAVAAKPQGNVDNSGDDGSGSSQQQQQQQQQNFQSQNEFTKTPKEILGEEFGEDWEEVKTKVTDWRTLATEYQEKKSELESLKNSQVNPFANEEVASFNEFVKKSKINDYSTFKYVKGIDLTNPDPVEIAVADRILANPELIGKESVIRAKIIREEGLDTENYGADEIAVNKATFAQKVAPMIERIKGLQEGKFVAPDPEANKKAVETAMADLKPEIQSVVSEITAIPIVATDQEGKGSKVLDYAVDAAKLGGKIEKITKILAQQGFNKGNITPEIKEIAKRSAMQEIMMEDFGKIVQSVITQTKTSLEEAYDLERHNPSAVNRGRGNANPVIRTADSEDQFVSNLIDN